MPPKKANAKRAPAPSAGPAAAATPLPPAEIPVFAAQHHVKVHEALAGIRGMFDGIDSAKPLTIQQGAPQKEYIESDARAALSVAGRYKCNGNLLWMDVIFNVTHRVPINLAQVREIQSYYLPDLLQPPEAFPFDVTVAVVPEHATHGQPALSAYFGTLQRLSPEEPAHALLFRIHEAIVAKVRVSVCVWQIKWRQRCICRSGAAFPLAPLLHSLPPARSPQKCWRSGGH